ncbi:hypothetical protein GCM10025738_21020 [Microbacterium fluvii]
MAQVQSGSEMHGLRRMGVRRPQRGAQRLDSRIGTRAMTLPLSSRSTIARGRDGRSLRRRAHGATDRRGAHAPRTSVDR